MDAIKIYQDILDSEKNYDFNVSLDLIQKVHTYHNYIEVIITNSDNQQKNEVSKKIDCGNDHHLILNLNDKLSQCEKEYKSCFIEKKLKDEQQFIKTEENINSMLKKKKKPQQLVDILDMLEIIKISSHKNDFWEHLSKEFSLITYFDANEKNESKLKSAYTFCGQTIKTINELEFIFATEFESLLNSRNDLHCQLKAFKGEIPSELVCEAADCHLSKNMPILRSNRSKKSQKCRLCKSDQTFKSYAKHLFSNSRDTVKLLSKQEESDDEEDANLMNRTTSDLEKLVKLINWFCRTEKSLVSFNEKLKEILEFNALVKTEFQHSRQFWISVSNLVNSMDELEMAKIRIRFIQPGETNTAKLDYIIDPNSINNHFMHHEYQKKSYREMLRKKLGQLLYLKHSSKKYTLTENQENTDQCPICQCNLGFEVKLYELILILNLFLFSKLVVYSFLWTFILQRLL